MDQIREHKGFKVFLFLLAISILTPSFVKFSHSFEDHVHEICKNQQKTHLHEFDLDCEFYKFKLNTQLSLILEENDQANTTNNYQPVTSQYQFTNTYQRLQFSLRGPPQLI